MFNGLRLEATTTIAITGQRLMHLSLRGLLELLPIVRLERGMESS